MRKPTRSRPPRASGKSAAGKAGGPYILRLYIAGATARSRQAILRAREVCENELAGKYVLEVIDIYQQPILARDGQILATPTLVKEFPKPIRMLIGSLKDTAGIILGLDLATPPKSAP